VRFAARLLLPACLLLAGCVSVPIDEVPASFETLRLLREQDVPPLAIGRFEPGPDGAGRRVMIRGSDIHAPKGSNFAEFLGETFASELRAAGKLDPASSLTLSGVLTDSGAGENISTGKARLAADITLTRGGQAILSKSYRVETEWKSDFIGAIAIPDAFREYNKLYALLVREVLGDPEFVAAAKGVGG
jgi:hypothetical protein